MACRRPQRQRSDGFRRSGPDSGREQSRGAGSSRRRQCRHARVRYTVVGRTLSSGGGCKWRGGARSRSIRPTRPHPKRRYDASPGRIRSAGKATRPAITRTIPVVLFSARAGEESRVEGLGAGADDYLVKPFTARDCWHASPPTCLCAGEGKKAEDALRESQATLQSFYDSSSFLMGVVELKGEDIAPVYYNTATATFFGTDVERIRSQTGPDLGIPRAIDDLWVRYISPKPGRGSGCSVRI